MCAAISDARTNITGTARTARSADRRNALALGGRGGGVEASDHNPTVARFSPVCRACAVNFADRPGVSRAGAPGRGCRPGVRPTGWATPLPRVIEPRRAG